MAFSAGLGKDSWRTTVCSRATTYCRGAWMRLGHQAKFSAWRSWISAMRSAAHPPPPSPNAIADAVRGVGAGQAFTELVKHLYRDSSSSSVVTTDGCTDPIPMRCSIRQGYPLSGRLFNLVVALSSARCRKRRQTTLP
ncbi:unnamed protein product [Ixodes pacificus]